MKLSQLKDKKILILGFGKEGKATLKYLKTKIPHLKIDYTDKNIDPHYLEKQKEYDLIIKTPGIPKRYVSSPYTTATNIFFANCQNPIIGVSGTKGKSTTSHLIHLILKRGGFRSHLVGNIGQPALEEILKPVTKDAIFVMELSSYQLDDIHYSPHVAVLINLFPEHMDYHQSLKNYYLAKKNLILFTKKGDFFVYNPRFKRLKDWAKKATCRSLPFIKKMPIRQSQTKLKGRHYWEDAKAAATVAKIFKVDDTVIASVLKEYRPLPHRLEYVGEFRGIQFYDDAISTTPQSTIEAIKALKKISTIFLGGLDRGYSFSLLAKAIKKYQIKNIVLFPESGKRILKAIKESSGTLPNILQTTSMQQAVRFAYRHTPKGSICLLSTASPSYSLWKNFEEKGNQFKFFVRQLARLSL